MFTGVLYLVLLAQVGNAQSPTLELQQINHLAELTELGDSAIGRDTQFEAVVTYADPIWDFIFVQEKDSAVFVSSVSRKDLELGDRVRIFGQVKMGDVSPYVQAKAVERLASGAAPDPIPVKISELKIGDYDSMFVGVNCVVLQALSSEGHTLLYCKEDETNTKFHVSTVTANKLEKISELVGAKMKFVGTLGVTLMQGTEVFDDLIGVRRVEMHRVMSMSDPILVSHPKDRTEGLSKNDTEPFELKGQVISRFPGFFILSDRKNATRIECENTHSLGVAQIVRVVGDKERNRNGELVFKAKAIESMFETRMPSPLQIDQLNADNSLWRYVKVNGQPTNIRKEPGRISFDVMQGGSTTKVNLGGQFHTSLDVLNKTRELEVRGVVSRIQSNGDPVVTVVSNENLILLKPIVPTWKYLVWLLIPLSCVFLASFAWIKLQRNRAESRAKAISAMHKRLVSTYQAISDGMLAVGRNGKVLSVNPEFCQFVGREMKAGEQIVPATCEEFLTRIKGRQKVADFIFTDVLRHQSEGNIEVEVHAPEYRSFDLCSSKMISSHGETVGMLLMLRDRTNERKLQADLIHANKIEAVGRLAGGIAHDFNNILTTISANLSLLSDYKKVEGQFLEKVEDAKVATHRGKELVRRLLTCTGKTELNPNVNSINAIIQEVHQFAKATFDARYEFCFELCPDDPCARVDSGAIEQVFLNLYLNARDAMPNGGCIKTETRLVSENDQPQVCIRITDDGPGISEDIRSEIFNPFFSTKHGQAGAGLGLSTSRKLILDHGGTLKIDPTSPRGSCFLITLPAVDRVEGDGEFKFETKPKAPLVGTNDSDKTSVAPKSDAATSTPEFELDAKQTILVVDDEDAIRKICKTILEMHGYDVLTAANGDAALETLKTDSQNVDLILLDMTMPGISGLDFLSISKETYPQIPVVLCSGYLGGVPEDFEEDCVKLPKPYSASKLVGTVSSVLVNRPEAAQG